MNVRPLSSEVIYGIDVSSSSTVRVVEALPPRATPGSVWVREEIAISELLHALDGGSDATDGSSSERELQRLIELARRRGENPRVVECWRELTDAALVERHARHAVTATNIAGAFDFDGVVAPVVVDADAATPNPAAAHAIAELARSTRGQIYLSARGPEDLRRRTGDVECWGNYGAAVLRRGSDQVEVAPGVGAAADRLDDFIHSICADGLPAGVAAHRNGTLAWGINLRVAAYAGDRQWRGALAWVSQVEAEAAECNLHSTGEHALSVDITVPGSGDKGAALERWLGRLDTASHPLDLITVAGDTEADAPMLRAATAAVAAGRSRFAECIAVRHPDSESTLPAGLLAAATMIAEGPQAIARLVTLQAAAARSVELEAEPLSA